jgi:hypothetical protein
MKLGLRLAVAALGVALGGASVAHAQDAPKAQSAAPDQVDRLALIGAAFAKDDPKPSPQRVTAMAFLPGRGVIRWDITGMTPEQAKEAQIEAMGLADARAVQQEIDARNAERQAARTQEQMERRAELADRGKRLALNMRAITGSAHQAGAVIPLNGAARNRIADALGVRDGAEMRGTPRVYTFAAISGRAVGLNLLHDESGWKNAGLTTDGDGFTGQEQAGIAWRAGATQTSLSWVHQKTQSHLLGMSSIKDQRVMLTISTTPKALEQLIAKTR